MYLQTVLKVGSLWAHCLISSGLSYTFPSLWINTTLESIPPILDKDTSYLHEWMQWSSDTRCKLVVLEISSQSYFQRGWWMVYLCKTHLYTHKALTCFLGVCCSFLLLCFYGLRISTQWKTWLFKACCQREHLCYFTTFCLSMIIWLTWKADILPTRALPQSWERMGWTGSP